MATYYRNPDQRDEIIEALQRLEANPGLLDRSRNRYNDPPPPYSSGKTTEAPSPGFHRRLDEFDARLEKKQERWQSSPESQYHSQCNRERERLSYQQERRRDGRRQTLPYDQNIKIDQFQWAGELGANAANNVRCRWIEQGIWNDEWGSQPGWPKVPGTAYPTPFWAHEDRPNPFAPQRREEPQLLFNLTGDLFGNTDTDQPQSPQGIAEDPESEPQRDTSASRPYYQFVYQVSQECEWIRDEADYARPGEPIDVNAAAHKSIKQFWQKSKIWDPQWEEMPGMKWMYEEPAEDEIDSSAGGSQPSLPSNHAQYESNSSVDNSPPVPPSNPQYEAAMRAAPPAQPPHNRSIFDQAIRPTHSNNNLLALASAEPPVARGFFGGRAADNNDLFAPRPMEASTEQTSEAPPTGRSIPENAPEPAHDSNSVAPESIEAPTGQREGAPAEMKESKQVSQVLGDTIEEPKNVDDHILRRVRSSKITKPGKATGPRTTRRQQRPKQDLIKSIAIASTEGLNEFSSKQGDNADANSHAPQPPRRSSRIAAKDADANDATGSVVEAEATKGIRQKRGANLSKPASSSRVPKSLKPQGIIKTRYQVGPKARKARQT